MFIYKASKAYNTGPRIWNCLQKKINVLVHIAKLKVYKKSFSRNIYETRRHKRASMSGNSKHSKNNLKIYVIIFANFLNVVDGRTILFYFIFG